MNFKKLLEILEEWALISFSSRGVGLYVWHKSKKYKTDQNTADNPTDHEQLLLYCTHNVFYNHPLIEIRNKFMIWK